MHQISLNLENLDFGTKKLPKKIQITFFFEKINIKNVISMQQSTLYQISVNLEKFSF